jgi:hypothetical protein
MCKYQGVLQLQGIPLDQCCQITTDKKRLYKDYYQLFQGFTGQLSAKSRKYHRKLVETQLTRSTKRMTLLKIKEIECGKLHQ